MNEMSGGDAENGEGSYASAVLTDLQSRLLADKDGEYRREVERELEAWEQEVRRTLQAGLPPDEYQAASRLSAGIEAAREVLTECCRRG